MTFYIICAQYMLEEITEEDQKEGRKEEKGKLEGMCHSTDRHIGCKFQRVFLLLCCPEMSEELHLFSGWSISPPITGTGSRGLENELRKSWLFPCSAVV